MNIYVDFEKPVKIFRNEKTKLDGTTYIQYNAGLNKKKVNSDEYESASFPIEFAQGTDLPSGTKIAIEKGDAWLSFYKYKVKDQNGNDVNRNNFFVKCKKFTIVGENKPQVVQDTYQEMTVKIDDVFRDFGDTVQIESDNSFLD